MLKVWSKLAHGGNPWSEKSIRKIGSDMNNELRSEYDLRRLRVRTLGPGRKSFGSTIRLEPDVAEVFPEADSVNEALRFLIRITKEKQPPLHDNSDHSA